MEFYVKRDSSSEEELQHYGILGMHWGVRRYQNKDGSYTKEGKERYNNSKKDPIRFYTKEELDSVVTRNRDDENEEELNQLMFLDLVDEYAPEIYSDDEKLSQEYEKFCNDPQGYVKSLSRSYNELQHHGILGMKWGIRRYQNPDGTLTDAGRRRLDKKDSKWAHRNYDKIYKKTYKDSKREVKQFVRDLDRQLSKKLANGQLSYTYVNAYNQGLAQIMNKNVRDIRAPSGKLVKWIAKRGEVGVHMALADEGYNLDQVKRGVYGSGRIAYKKNSVTTA